MKQSHSSLRQNRGFTLVEVLITIFLLTFGILGIGALLISSIHTNALTNSITNAVTWGSDILERLNSSPYTDPNLTDTDGDGVAGLNDTTAATADFQVTRDKYTISWNVAVDAIGSNCKTVNVIVTWMEGTQQKLVSMQDIIAAM